MFSTVWALTVCLLVGGSGGGGAVGVFEVIDGAQLILLSVLQQLLKIDGESRRGKQEEIHFRAQTETQSSRDGVQTAGTEIIINITTGIHADEKTNVYSF